MSIESVSDVCSTEVVSSKTNVVTGTKRGFKESDNNYDFIMSLKDYITTETA
jgi:hypothetical protein